jgi:hypothetical protein
MLPSNVRTVCGWMAFAACLVSATLAFRGCRPAGLGSIKVGSPSQWRKEPVAPPAPSWNPKRVVKRMPQGPPADQAPYRSIKDLLRDRNLNWK